ncbi:hypothetical protein [Streptomyces brevispora]|uniref:hypothetical protein n=1 Tax=Streptomyces brevispora TaxID=887462 RepID=UPI0035DBF8AD
MIEKFSWRIMTGALLLTLRSTMRLAADSETLSNAASCCSVGFVCQYGGDQQAPVLQRQAPQLTLAGWIRTLAPQHGSQLADCCGLCQLRRANPGWLRSLGAPAIKDHLSIDQ